MTVNPAADAENLLFKPGVGVKDCTEQPGGWGTPNTLFDYIWKGDISQATYPPDACPPRYHSKAQIDTLQVNTLLTSPTITGTGGSPCTITGVASGNKLLASFDIPHVKEKGKRIRHIITEGPEAGIYVRGKVVESSVIELPEYWDGLVDPDTITVTLTQIGHSQDLIVESIEGCKTILLKSGVGASINCHYEVWAARWLDPMDHDQKLQVVYDGESPDDYPGGNENFLVGGWDYDQRNTQWEEKE